MSWLLAFAGFAALIVLHEGGHFAAAKGVGMRVERFFLFFPPRLASFRRGETEYGIGALPLGGFVKITGMNPEEKLPPEVAHRGYYRQPVWKRVVVIAAGPAVNAAIAFGLFFALAFGVSELTEKVGKTLPGSPAEGRLLPGDRIVAVDGRRGDALDLARQINRHRCPGRPRASCRARTPARVRIVRRGQGRTLSIRPTYDARARRHRIGFSFAVRPLDPSPAEAARLSADFMWEVTSSTVGVLARLFDPQQREQISGVVGGYEVTRQAIEFNARRALTLLGVISLSLAVINLFPFLPLDGGHIFWSLVEKLRRRPVPFGVMERASYVGFMLVLFLFFVGLSNDIGRLTGEGFEVR